MVVVVAGAVSASAMERSREEREQDRGQWCRASAAMITREEETVSFLEQDSLVSHGTLWDY